MRQEKWSVMQVTSYYPFLLGHLAASSLARDHPLSLWLYHLSLSAPEMSPLYCFRIAHFFFFFPVVEKWSTVEAPLLHLKNQRQSSGNKPGVNTSKRRSRKPSL